MNKNTIQYFICDAYTNKGIFHNCLYKYVTYYERYVIESGSKLEISVEKEGLYSIKSERLSEDQVDHFYKTGSIFF
jgi:hypothetical protein